MAEIEPFRALHYDPAVTGGLQNVVAPPYDVIDDEQRLALEARSPYNVVRIDLPQGGEDRYQLDRKSTRLNSSHAHISYAVFCLKKNEKQSESIHALLNTRELSVNDRSRVRH